MIFRVAKYFYKIRYIHRMNGINVCIVLDTRKFSSAILFIKIIWSLVLIFQFSSLCHLNYIILFISLVQKMCTVIFRLSGICFVSFFGNYSNCHEFWNGVFFWPSAEDHFYICSQENWTERGKEQALLPTTGICFCYDQRCV